MVEYLETYKSNETKLNNSITNNNFKHKIMRPKPINKEVTWDKTQLIMSKTDLRGIIEYVNPAFLQVSGYTEEEVLGKPHNILRHPDMPKAVFKILWDNLKLGNNSHAVVKNLAKSGEYYWVATDFDMIIGSDGAIKGYMGRRKAFDDDVVTSNIEPLYKKLLEIEAIQGEEASVNYLMDFLKEKNTTYKDYVRDLVKLDNFFGGIFRK